MVRVRVTVEPKGLLVLGRAMDSGQNVRESRDYIAGSVLRGALAQVIMERLNQHRTSRRTLPSISDAKAQSAFESIFLSASPARFGFLYPAYRSENAEVQESFPAPVTARACKPYGTKHPLLDTLRRALRNELSSLECPECGERIERWRGYIVRLRDGTYNYCTRASRKPLVRIGLNRWTATVAEGILYVLDAIVADAEPGRFITFTGYWTMSQEQWKELQFLLQRFFAHEDNGYRLRIGSARARGLGEVILRCEETKFSDLTERLDTFQQGLPENDRYIYFSLTARSPVLVYDETGLPAKMLTPAVLQAYLSTIPEGLELIKDASFVEWESLTGWSQAWGLPKPITLAISAGSVFCYRAPKNERDTVIAFLREIETHGLGERRAEGLGDLVACEPFHITTSAR